MLIVWFCRYRFPFWMRSGLRGLLFNWFLDLVAILGLQLHAWGLDVWVVCL